MKGFRVGAGDGERIEFSGAEFVVRATGETTGGAFSIIEEIDPLDTPRHMHSNEDELWYILEGEHIFQIGDDEVTAGPGDIVFAPRGVPHSQRRVTPRTGRFLEFYTPAGFEGFFRELAEAEQSGAEMPEVYRSVSDRYGITWG